MCTHKNLVKEEPSIIGVTAQINNENTGELLPEYILYSPYICQDCGKRYLVLNAIVE